MRSRAIQPLSKEKYDTIVKLVNGTKIPKTNRTKEQEAGCLKFRRSRNDFALDSNGLLLYKDKHVILKTQVKDVVENEFMKAKGCGARAISLRLRRKYSGLSELAVDKVLKKSKMYHKHYPKFTNVPKPKIVTASNVGERWQIDLMDMRSDNIEYQGETYRYILSIMDIYSRYVFLRPLSNKTSKSLKQAVESIVLEHGAPRIIQCDNGCEFKGFMNNLYKKYNIKIIRSSPFHPQPQGKVEKVHRSVRKKILFQSRRGKGFNWAKSLRKIAFALNTTPKICLGKYTPYEIYFGRLKKDPTSDLQKAAKVYKKRIQAKAATAEYLIKERVLIKYPFNRHSRVPRKRYVFEALVISRDLNKGKYEVRFRNDKGRLTTSWISVEYITSLTMDLERQRKKKRTSRYYITKDSQTEPIDLLKAPGDGNCQFSAVSYQLSLHGFYQSHQSLRKLACDHIIQNAQYYEEFIEGHINVYHRAMLESGTYGDHCTLLAISRELNLQVLVVSVQGLNYSKIISNDGIYDPEVQIIFWENFPENRGEHYTSISVQGDRINAFIIQDNANSAESVSDMDSVAGQEGINHSEESVSNLSPEQDVPNTLSEHNDTVTQDNESVDKMDSVAGQEGINHNEESVANLSPEQDVSNTLNEHDNTVIQDNEDDAESVDDMDSVAGREGINHSEESVANLSISPEQDVPNTLNEHDDNVTQNSENNAESVDNMDSVDGQERINHIEESVSNLSPEQIVLNILNEHDYTVTYDSENNAESVDNTNSVAGQEGIIHSEESVSNLSPEHDVSNTLNGHDDTVTQNSESNAESVDNMDSVDGQERINHIEESVSNLSPEQIVLNILNEHDYTVTHDSENNAESVDNTNSVAGQEGIIHSEESVSNLSP